MEPNTGIIYVKNGALLDREVRSVFLATLQARDTDEKPGTTVLEITLIDINDNAPVFNRDSYLVFVKEGGQVEVTIEVSKKVNIKYPHHRCAHIMDSLFD